MLATRDARHPQRDGPGGNPHLRIPRRLLLLELFAVAFVDVGPDRHVPAAQVRQPPDMLIQLAFDLLDLLCVFPAQQTILAGTQYIETVVGVLVIQQLKGVGPRVENVHHPLARRRRANRLASSLPKPALAIRVFRIWLASPSTCRVPGTTARLLWHKYPRSRPLPTGPRSLMLFNVVYCNSVVSCNTSTTPDSSAIRWRVNAQCDAITASCVTASLFISR